MKAFSVSLGFRLDWLQRPSAFQKMMQTVLRKLDGVKNDLDDIIVYGNSQETHDKHLQSVSQRLEEVGLQINFDISSFNQASIPFLDHVISKQGLRPSPDHLIGTSYYRHGSFMFIPRAHFMVQHISSELCYCGWTTEVDAQS